MQAMKKLGRFAAPYKLFIILAPILMVIEVTMDLLQPTILKHLIDDGIAQNNSAYMTSMFIYMLICAVIGLIGGAGCSYFSSKAAIHFSADMRKALYEASTYFSGKNRTEHSTGHLITVLTSDVETVQRAFMMLLRVFVRGPLLFIGAIIMVYISAREFFTILAVIVPILILCIYTFLRFSGTLYRKVQQATDVINTTLQENLSGIRVVKAFVREKYHQDKFATANTALTKRYITAEQVVGLMTPLTLLFVNLGIVAALWSGAIQYDAGKLNIGVVLAFINYLTITMNGLMSSSMVLMQIARAVPSCERIVNVLETERDIVNSATPYTAPLQGKVRFNNVSYHYYKTGEDIIKHISFEAQAGETIGIIGKTGSGKSTIVKLIPRLFDVTAGEITIDDVPIAQHDIKNLRANIGFTPQKAQLFSGTIEKNIRVGKTNASDKALQQALDDASASEFIAKFAEGTAHELTQEATNVSGGQKQRLSLARAFVRQPKILILDDTTSALDSISERNVQQAIAQNYAQATTFIIASKISSIAHADKILVLDDGVLVGNDTHEKLLQDNAVYQAIYATQTKVVQAD